MMVIEMPVEVKIACTTCGFLAREEDLQHTERLAGTVVIVRWRCWRCRKHEPRYQAHIGEVS